MAGIQATIGRGAVYVIAGANASAHMKSQADDIATGTSDETKINALSSALTSGRTWIETIKLVGDFSIDGSILCGTYQELDLTQAKITLANGSNCDIIRNVDLTGGNTYCIVRGGILNGNSAGQGATSYGIEFKKVTNGLITNTYVSDTYSAGIDLDTNTDVTVRDSIVASTRLQGIYDEGNTKLFLINNRTNICGSVGFEIYGSSAVFSGNYSYQCNHSGFEIYGSYNIFSGNYAYHNNETTTYAGAGFYLLAGATYNQFSACVAKDNHRYGFLEQNNTADYNIIVGCHASGSTFGQITTAGVNTVAAHNVP